MDSLAGTAQEAWMSWALGHPVPSIRPWTTPEQSWMRPTDSSATLVSTSCTWADGPQVLKLSNSTDSRSNPTSHPHHPCCLCVVKLSVWPLLNGAWLIQEQPRMNTWRWHYLPPVCDLLSVQLPGNPSWGRESRLDILQTAQVPLAGGPGPVCPKVDSPGCKHSVSATPHTPFGGELCPVEVDKPSIHRFDIKDVNRQRQFEDNDDILRFHVEAISFVFLWLISHRSIISRSIHVAAEFLYKTETGSQT